MSTFGDYFNKAIDYVPNPVAQGYNAATKGTVFGQDVSGGLSAAKDWMFGGKATQGMASEPATAAYQRGYLQNDFMNRAAPQVGAPNTAQADQTRGQQGTLAGMLFKTASGQMPGAGELAVQRGVGQAQAQQTSAAQMARGAGAALAMRNAARTSADIGVNGAGQAGIARMQDQTNAQNQLGGLLGTQRSQDMAQTQQGIGVAQGNQQAQMQQQQLQLNALAQMLGVDSAALQQDLAKRGLQMQDKGMFPSLLQIGGQIGAAAATGGFGGDV